MPIKLEVGKKYRNRLGGVVEIAGKKDCPDYPFYAMGQEFTEDGYYTIGELEHNYDLIEEVAEVNKNLFDLEAFKRGEIAITRDGCNATYVAYDRDCKWPLVFKSAQRIYATNENGLVDYYGNDLDGLDLVAMSPKLNVPKSILINGLEVPEPIQDMPKDGATVYVVSLDDSNPISCRLFRRSEVRNIYVFKRGLCHYARDAAGIHAKALLSFTGSQA